jgi:hypothetical protein
MLGIARFYGDSEGAETLQGKQHATIRHTRSTLGGPIRAGVTGATGVANRVFAAWRIKVSSGTKLPFTASAPMPL